MDMKTIFQPKWWLTVVGALFTLFMLLTYAEIVNAAEAGWGADSVSYTHLTLPTIYSV